MPQKNIWQRKHLKANKTDGNQEIQNEQKIYFSISKHIKCTWIMKLDKNNIM